MFTLTGCASQEKMKRVETSTHDMTLDYSLLSENGFMVSTQNIPDVSENPFETKYIPISKIIIRFTPSYVEVYTKNTPTNPTGEWKLARIKNQEGVYWGSLSIATKAFSDKMKQLNADGVYNFHIATSVSFLDDESKDGDEQEYDINYSKNVYYLIGTAFKVKKNEQEF